ncbi:MAG: glycosyltransferase family 2 protein [Candidatus Moraniibacteriota bacterium]|nr:MAG: glycosyltransferase family 2 protein [Candidatus Moranbacteria bacterium]
MRPKYSVVVPLYNEEGNVKALHERIVSTLRALGAPFEILFVDDGSKDETVATCRTLSPLTLILLRKNFGQSAAFDGGFKQAAGDIIITMDGDLQNDPADIPNLLKKLEEGYDVVAGWRVKRKDSLEKIIFSRVANMLRSILIHDGIHDSGCSLKVYRRECFEDFDLFGEMHRFIPALLEIRGFRVAEIPVSHHPRVHGVTKYNWKRGVKGFVDMLAVWFWRTYSHRPVHLFGGSGFFLSVVGFGILSWMFIEKVFFGASLSERIWPMIGIFLLLAGIQLFIFGLMTDMLVRSYYRGRGAMNYTIRSVIEQR